MVYEQLISGIIFGIGYSIAGWKGQINKTNKIFNWTKLIKSVIICGAVGGIAGYMNADFGVLLTGATGIGITKAVSTIWDLAKKYVWKK